MSFKNLFGAFHLSMLTSDPVALTFFVCSLISMISVFIICLAVFIDFSEYQQRSDQKKETKSFVETGTMFLFFFLYYAVVRSGFGRIGIESTTIALTLAMIGTIAMVVGCFVNVRGRFDLGKNWSNQIKVYQDHTFVTHGMYRLVRHPLYASLIWMFLGGSILYANVVALVCTICIFVPAMTYRAKQEEVELLCEFPEYKEYQKSVGMFFPKIY
jgi:protein-S-isoprenylcysteine O-methyltransferase Ste14